MRSAVTTEQQRSFSPEVQGLRAVAVLSVLIFHVWPHRLPGGYVGVDVFFVISGYLITGVLLRELHSTGFISLVGFYQRRIKRLLPAATVTLLGTALAFRLLPVVSWSNAAQSTIASTLYVQNWWLANEATDYWAQGESAGTLQHFWSLSVEEQFYFFWPLLLLVVAWIARRLRRHPERAIGAFIVIVGSISLTHCIHLSLTRPEIAYFATTTRVWELALGGVLAVWPKARVSASLSQVMGGLGLAMIICACVFFDSDTVFPGYAALLPTLGAAALLLGAKGSSRRGVFWILRGRVCQFYGDISYSLYLWHWPVIIYYRQLTGREPRLSDGLIIIALSGALAHQSKLLVEDPFRKNGVADARGWHTLLLAGCCMATTLMAGWWIERAYSLKLDIARTASAQRKVASATNKKVGPLEVDETRILAALQAKDDAAPWYNAKCRSKHDTVVPVACVHGNKDSEFSIALIGDSHAVHWEPAFIALANKRNWDFSLYAKTSCSMGDHSVYIGKNPVRNESCDDYRRALVLRLKKEKPNLVVIAQFRGHQPYGISNPGLEAETIASSLERTARELQSEYTQVLIMADTPWLDTSVPECLSDPNYVVGSCASPVEKAFARVDPAVLVARGDSGIRVIEMNEHLCDPQNCHALVSDMVVYRDRHHLTAQFARSLADELGEALAEFVPPL